MGRLGGGLEEEPVEEVEVEQVLVVRELAALPPLLEERCLEVVLEEAEEFLPPRSNPQQSVVLEVLDLLPAPSSAGSPHR
jgi:hypothetical protein